MASVPYAITTAAKVKAFLGLSDTDVARDGVLDDICAGVTDYIEGYVGGRRFLATDYVELHDTYRTDKIFLRQFPVTAVSDVSYRSGRPSAPTWITYYVDGYLVYLGAGYIQFFAKFVNFPMAFRVTYNAGYLIDWAHFQDPALHTLPHDLTQVATELAAQKYNWRMSQGIYQESTEGQSITYESDRYSLNDDHKSVLNRYKISRVAP